MFITTREKSIIELIVRTSGRHTVHSLATFLHVSVRTVQRDLKSIEKILEELNLELKRTTTEGLFIDGKNEQIYRLIQTLTGASPTDETPEERKLRLLIILMEEGPSFKKQVLANQLGISNATLTAYLDELEEWLGKFSITLTRKRGVGVELEATEAGKRHALANYFLAYFYESFLENLYVLQQGKEGSEKILGYFSPQYLLEIDRLVNQMITKGQARLGDRDYIGLIIHLCLSVQRTANNFFLAGSGEAVLAASNEYQFMQAVCEELAYKLDVSLTADDVQFLAVVLRGSNVKAADVIYYDSIVLGRLIKTIIQDVSAQLHVHLSDDFSLYQGLLAHMEPAIYRLKQKLELFNPLTEEVKQKYPVLFKAVKKSLQHAFPDIEFPDDEISYIVLHFGSALLMKEEKVKLKAVVICPTGIGASKMLASRIQKELAEIKAIEILSINDTSQVNLDTYDLVLSTVRLPFTDVDYILVSPLLSDEDIEAVESYLQNNLEKLTRKKQYLTPENQEETVPADSLPSVQVLLQEVKDVHSSMDAILNNLKVYRKNYAGDEWEILEQMVEQMKGNGLVMDTPAVMHQLKEREKQGGLGIPGTDMGLFHCRDNSIKQLVFQIAHLDKPCTIKGMDGKALLMKNVLLMLAPAEMSNREQEILSLISTSLIESRESMMMFSSSNENIIRQKLENLFLDYLQNNLIRR